MLKLMEEIWSWWGHTGDGSVQNGVFFGRPRLARSALQSQKYGDAPPLCKSWASVLIIQVTWVRTYGLMVVKIFRRMDASQCALLWMWAMSNYMTVRTHNKNYFWSISSWLWDKDDCSPCYEVICHGNLLATAWHIFQRNIIKNRETNQLLATMCTVLVRLCDNSIIIMWMSQNLAIDSPTVKTSINLLLPSSWSGRRFL